MEFWPQFSRSTIVVLCLTAMVVTWLIYSEGISSIGSSTPNPVPYGAEISPDEPPASSEATNKSLNAARRNTSSTPSPVNASSARLTSSPLNPTIPPPAYLTLGILYLVQTENCLPPYLQSNDVLGNGSLGFDVIVLSYKEACDNHTLPHIQYLLNTATTWSTGRNLLFETAMSRNRTYLYYIFMDDDISLIDVKQMNPWRKFESFLRSVEPAIAAIDLTGDHYTQNIRNIHNERKCSREEDYVACLWYDAIFNAFHHKAVRHILPYDPTFDRETWWASQMAVIVRSEVLFRGQVVLHTEIFGENNAHRPYPRDINFSQHMFDSWLAGLAEKHLPPDRIECANVYVQQWRTMGRGHGWSSSTLCLPPPPPHDVIEPGRYACT